MHNFSEEAISAIENGYHVVPLKIGEKACRIPGWTTKEFDENYVKAHS